jgi:hypothetical protein
MKLFCRNAAMMLFLLFTVGSIWGCAEKPIRFDETGVQIWKMTIVWDDGFVLEDQTLVLKPSETDKDVFHVTADMEYERESKIWGRVRISGKWRGEVRNGRMLCDINYVAASVSGGGDPQGDTGTGTAKGTFSDRRASGTSKAAGRAGPQFAKWTAERVS